MPDSSLLQGSKVDELPLDEFLEKLNERIARDAGREKQIGHSFLLDGGKPVTEPEEFARRFRQEILPLLQEYCYDDWSRLEQILKKGLVDTDRGRFRSELFEPGREEDLVQAVLAIAPDVSASFIAVEAEAQQAPDGDVEEQEETDETTEA
jgi:5-methylcytosine-specific restriction protein B